MEHTAPAPGGSIVVGIDDSPQSQTALRWAAGLARDSNRHLDAVHVVTYDARSTENWAGTIPSLVYSDDGKASASQRRAIVAMFDDVQPEPGWDLTFAQGPVGEFLVGHACSAHLLVVGTGEHRGVNRFLTGSVSRYCVTYSSVPVTAVPTPRSHPAIGQAAPGLPLSQRPDQLAGTP